jgi:aspartyl-tRNA(Asn)/glutamyl-tRNA(Gln) amidotransferase subunit B
MQEGSLRADVNVSVRKKGDTKLGTRTEMKNMNSFKSIIRALDYEIERQIDIVDNGGKIDQETLRWDEVSGKTFSMRDKEDAQDYRYFPEPDLATIKLSEEYIENIRKTLPEMPESRKKRYLNEYKLSEKDATIITSSKYLSDLFENAGKICGNYKAVNNWIISDISRILNEKEMEPTEIPFSAEQLASLVSIIDKGIISSSIAKKVIEELFEKPADPDETEIKKVILKVIQENEQSVKDYKNGKERALGFLVGQAMKATKGKANPQILNKMFMEELGR